VDVNTVTDLMVSVEATLGDGEVVAVDGEFAGVGTMTYKGRQVAKTFRFTPSVAMTTDITAVELLLSQGIQSYNGVPTMVDVVLPVSLVDAPPGKVTWVAKEASANGILLQWVDP